MIMGQFNITKLVKYNENLRSNCAAIAVLAAEIWREHYTPIIGTRQVEYMLEKFQSAEQIYTDIMDNGYIYFIAERVDTNSELAGYSAVVRKADCLLLSKIYVHKDFRGRGVARKFMDEVLALCKHEFELGKIRLTVNKNNIDTIMKYKKMGFKIVDSVKVDIGNKFFMDDFIMEYSVL